MRHARVQYGAMRVLIALSNEQLAEFLWHFLRENKADVVQMVSSPRAAIQRMQSTIFTHFFLDYDLGENGGVDFAKFIRMAERPVDESPILMIMPTPDRAKVLGARDAGVNEILGLPLTAKLIEHRLLHMTAAPKPFVRSTSYTGPCRRREPAVMYHGEERRDGRTGTGRPRRVLVESMAR